jgi:hypothetical protein
LYIYIILMRPEIGKPIRKGQNHSAVFSYTVLRGAVGLVKGVKYTRLLVKQSLLGIVSMRRGVHARFM